MWQISYRPPSPPPFRQWCESGFLCIVSNSWFQPKINIFAAKMAKPGWQTALAAKCAKQIWKGFEFFFDFELGKNSLKWRFYPSPIEILLHTRDFRIVSFWCVYSEEKHKHTVGSEIRTSLDFKWSKRGCVANVPDFERDLKSRSPTIWNPDKWLPFFQKPFEILTNIQI